MSLAECLKLIKKNKGLLTSQQMRTLRGQALSGDITGAVKGLNKLIKGE